MTDRPTIYLTNWSWFAWNGPPEAGGRAYTIMRRPRTWEHGEGTVRSLTPTATDLDLVRRGDLTPIEYADRCRALFGAHDLRYGKLIATSRDRNGVEHFTTVESGSVLCCGCSKASADRGLCHRCVAADLLLAAGWRVWLDQRPMEG